MFIKLSFSFTASHRGVVDPVAINWRIQKYIYQRHTASGCPARFVGIVEHFAICNASPSHYSVMLDGAGPFSQNSWSVATSSGLAGC